MILWSSLKLFPHILGYLFIQVCLERFCGRLFNNKSKIVLFLFSAFTETQIPSEIFKLACNILKNKLYIKSNFTAPLRKKNKKVKNKTLKWNIINCLWKTWKTNFKNVLWSRKQEDMGN